VTEGSGGDLARRTIEVAEGLLPHLEAEGVKAVLIGSVACAAHNYTRATRDLDLATYTDPNALSRIERRLKAAGFEAEYVNPDPYDPLGGVVNIDRDDINRIQIVNFWNPYGGRDNPGSEVIETSTALPGSPLRVADLPHLIALKLYGGGTKNRLDVLELIRRNHPVDLAALRAVCGRFDLGPALEGVLAEFEDLEGPGAARSDPPS
jgi:hypothetical protein